MSSLEPKSKKLDLNRVQLLFAVSKFAAAICLWGRATGKSSIIAWLILLIIKTLPRSKWVILGSTFQQLLTVTLPSTIGSLARLGLYKDVHYFVGRRPPKTWKAIEPYEPPLKYDHCIYFWKEGVVFQMVSQDGGATSARGGNFDGSISDESLLINKDQYDREVLPTLRGNRRFFKNQRLHHGEFHFSSMPYDASHWLLKGGEHYIKAGYDFISLQNEMIDLQLKFIDNKDVEFRKRLWGDINRLSKELRFYPDPITGLLYSEANAFENLRNLGIKYLEQQRESLTEYVFLMEVLNQRPGKVEAGFYPTLSLKKHTYNQFENDAYLEGLNYQLDRITAVDSRMDGDCVSTQPLRLAVDWGAKISSLTVAQDLNPEYRFLKGFYVKHPKLITDLAEEFCDYYQYHLSKRIYFLPDKEHGDHRRADSKLSYNQQFMECLKKRGWTVTKVELGRMPRHQARYHLAHEMFSEKNPRLPKVRFNKVHCKDVLTALTMAPVKEGRDGQIAKDKSSEGRASTPAQEATHFTDTVDLHLVSIDKYVIRRGGNFSDLVVVTS